MKKVCSTVIPKLGILLSFIVMISQNTHSQHTYVDSGYGSTQQRTYKIKFCGDNSRVYQIQLFIDQDVRRTWRDYFAVLDDIPDSTILQIFHELLSYRRDVRLGEGLANKCIVMSSGPCVITDRQYSLQIQALQKINQLYINWQPWYFYSPVPLLCDTNTSICQGISGDEIDSAYNSYVIWLARIKAMGLNSARKQRLLPLENRTIQWFDNPRVYFEDLTMPNE